MKRNEISIQDLNKAVRKKDEIDISNKEVIAANEIMIVKRDGREERYNPHKMQKVVSWACKVTNGSCDLMTKELLSSVSIKLYDRIKIVDVYDELIKTAANKISMLYPEWEYVAARLYLLKIYKESWGIVGQDHYYPHITEIIRQGETNKIYDRKIFDKYSDAELNVINSFIDKERDYLFTFKALVTFYDKYCLNYVKTKKLELPQFTYLRVAMALMVNDSNRIDRIKELYDALSTHKFTFATPIMINAGTCRQQLSSCVLNKVADDTHSILDTTKNIAVYSKFKGGTALDISELRAKGSYISGNQGQSSGPVPFIKIVESSIKAFNQGGARPGACAIYFQWWHYDFEDLIVLKSNSGTEENRARALKYGVKINQLLINRVIANEDVTLFDPKDAKNLLKYTGKVFDKVYEELEQKVGIRKKKINARELFFKIIKERTETGNIYLFHEENVNSHNMVGRKISSSNLCIKGDSKIHILIDNETKMEIEIEQLPCFLGKHNVKVLSKIFGDNEINYYSNITNFAETNPKAKVMKITDEKTKKSIICTPEHLIWTENRKWIEAKNLREDDILKIL